MPSHRAWLTALWVLAVLASCRSGDKTVVADSAVANVLPASPVNPPALNPGWDASTAGPVMLLSVSDNVSRPAVVLPFLTDSTLSAASAFGLDSLSGMSFDLFGPSGHAGSSSLVVGSQKPNVENCPQWPEGSLAETPGRPWRIGFRKGLAVPLPLDSVEMLSSSDSSRIVAEITRIASALAGNADPAFQGLPFSVRKTYRFSFDGRSALVSDVVRRINEEANPRAEHILLIAERPLAGNGRYVAAFHSRVAGSADIVRTHEILSAVRFVRSNTPAIVVAFGYEEGGRIALLERGGDGSWKLSWRSAYAGC